MQILKSKDITSGPDLYAIRGIRLRNYDVSEETEDVIQSQYMRLEFLLNRVRNKSSLDPSEKQEMAVLCEKFNF